MSPPTLFARYRPHIHQARVHRSGRRWLVVLAGARGGKTLCCAKEHIARTLTDLAQGRCNDVPATGDKDRRPRHHSWICAPFNSLLDEPKRRVLELLDGSGLIDSWDRSLGKLWLHGGALIEFKSVENKKAAVGVGLQGMWIDEADRIADHDVWHGQLAMRLRDHQGWCLFSSTPEMARAGFLYSEFISRAGQRPDIDLITWKTEQNPHIARSEVEQARETTPPRYFAREWCASIDAFTGLVFALKQEVHVRSERQFRMERGLGNRDLRTIFKRIGGFIDWGYSDPGCILVVGDTGEQLVVLDEVYETQKPVIDPSGSRNSWAWEASRLRDLYSLPGPAAMKFHFDPSQPGYAQQLSLHGLVMYAAKNSIADGVRRVEEALVVRQNGHPGLIIFDRCKNLIREMLNLQYKKNRDGSSTEEPEDRNNHSTDCLRYSVLEYRYHQRDTNVPAPRFGYGTYVSGG